MPDYLTPSVYVEDIPAGNKPINGIDTNTAAFIGVVTDEVVLPSPPAALPTGGDVTPATVTSGNPVPGTPEIPPAFEPRLITSWLDFQNLFGDVQKGNEILAQAALGFFLNGGQRCWITRLPALPDQATTHTALRKLEEIKDIALVAIPGATSAGVQSEVIEHCEKVGRFGILDGEENPASLTPSGVKSYDRASSFAAMYFPWLDLGEIGPDGNTKHFPPSGHVAGVYARVDQERGIHRAPANMAILGAEGLKFQLTGTDQEPFNRNGINIIRQINGQVTIWGARTLGNSDEDWKYVSVRRMLLFLEKSIYRGTVWAVFEPNGANLWAQLRQSVDTFLSALWQSGALAGSSPREAFYVKCDKTTNPPDLQAQGMMRFEIGVALLRPAEFIVFPITQKAGVIT